MFQSEDLDAIESVLSALRDAFSCYYSGNFVTGHQHGYVGKVLAAWSSRAAQPAGGSNPFLSQAKLSLPQ